MDLPDDPEAVADHIEEIDRQVRELCTPQYLAVKKQQIMGAVLDAKLADAHAELIASLDAVVDVEAGLASIHAKFPPRKYSVVIAMPIDWIEGVDATIQAAVEARTIDEALHKAQRAAEGYPDSRITSISETEAPSGSA